MSFDEWQRHFCSESACVKYLFSQRWPVGFSCPTCGHNGGYLLSARRLYECKNCHQQTSVTAGTVFHASKVRLTKWFWAIYWMSSSGDAITALQMSQLIGVSWHTAKVMNRKLRAVMGSRNCLYRVTTIIELDAALIECRVRLAKDASEVVKAQSARRRASMLITSSAGP